MKKLSLPKDFDFMMYVNCLFLFMIAFFMMTFSNGETTITYINNMIPMLNNTVASQIPSFNFSIGNEQNINQNIGNLMKYKNDLISQDFKLPYFCLLIYWIILPIFNLGYGVYCFKKGLLRGTKNYTQRQQSLKIENH